ncbi:tRNA-splicing endonuclease subunit Sen34-like isoform X2 [Artemia franciscana]|uniref:tRNA-splicing endonuclease subunit Sen34-like isoform X2 n=1 Tax=Artemia franciscana TaxID=6661 RepID=UPI0032DA7D0E
MVISQVPRTILWQFLWKTSNILYLRKELRIVGQLEGCLASLPRQLNLCGRPLRLMNEEAHFLLKNNYCELLSCSDLASPPTKQSADNFKEIQNRAFEEQRLLVKEEKMQQILRAGEKILEGKRRKLNKEAAKSGNEPPPLTLEQAVDEEIRRIPELTQANALVQIFTDIKLFSEHPVLDCEKLAPISWDYPSSENDKIRATVYGDLWAKGFYITGGEKFGGDFLVYPGDPVRFHAKYIAICLPFEGLLTPFQIAVHARVAVSVNKKVLLCTVNSDSRVIYKYLEWLDAKREKMSQETIK